MADKKECFRCPCCGMHAPIDRITEEGPWEFALFEKDMGGRKPLTDEEKEDQILKGYRKFKVPGILHYEPLPMSEEMLEAMKKRLQEVISG